ncbi:transposase, IS4 family protein, partial [mine drainage metagenome]
MWDFGVETDSHRSGDAMSATDDATPILPGLSPACGRAIEARFDGGLMSSDGGLLMLREVERRLGIARRLAACIDDPRAPVRIRHGLDEVIRFRMLMIAAGYEDGNDADSLRTDPLFKLAMERLPEDAALCSQSTVSRAENLPDRHALLRMGQAMVEHYCQSFRQVPRRIVLDIDDTFDAMHGGQQLRLFNAHYDEYSFQPIVVFDGEGRMVAALLRPACRPSGRQIVFWLHRLIAALRANWPRVEILLRADSHYCTPEVLR